MRKEHFGEKLFAVMSALILLIGITACGNNSGQSESRQDTAGQTEEHTEEDSAADSAGEAVAGVPESDTEPGSTTDDTETADTEEGTESNILIACFSRVGNMDFDKNIDAVTSASVNMDGSEVAGNAQLLTGLSVRGSDAGSAQAEVEEWLDSSGILE